jgi:hypothetical protein
MILHRIPELGRTIAEPEAEKINQQETMAHKTRMVGDARETGGGCRPQTMDKDEGVPFAREIMIAHVRVALRYEECLHPFLL